ncbi:MAG: hypothetical protein AAGC85_19305, partial [Bacteroidota bacterium]
MSLRRNPHIKLAKEIETLIADNRIDDAIQTLKTTFLDTELVEVQARFSELTENHQKGILDTDQYRIERNRIVDVLIGLTKKLKKGPPKAVSTSRKSSSRKGQKSLETSRISNTTKNRPVRREFSSAKSSVRSTKEKKSSARPKSRKSSSKEELKAFMIAVGLLILLGAG